MVKPPWICLCLFLVTAAVYSPVRHFGFVNFDDPDYVSANPHVRRGLTADTAAWAWQSTEAANWFPLTRLSHLLDYQLFGLDAGPQHVVSVVLHALAAVFLFLFLHRATGSLWPGTLVAFLFALHPLHVESVAWISERKDVLCALFWFLGLWAYVWYAERPTPVRYGLVLAPFILGLLSKPMIVTFPLLLLLLDWWPLKRRALLEKVPFFALSAASAVVTFAVQRGAGATEALQVPLASRAGNALLSYAGYIVTMFWPARLAVFYPYPKEIPVWEVMAAAAVLCGITGLLVWAGVKQLLVGWAWYLVTLLPVIGLVQVGAQSHADRYTYVPMVGIWIMLAWAVQKWRAVAIVTAAACIAFVPVTWAQIGYWYDSETLFRHALAVTDDNDVAHHNLGVALAEVPGKLPEAIQHYRAAIAIRPDSARAHTDLGSALARLPGHTEEAIAEYREALRIAPDAAIPHNNLGNALLQAGRVPEAIAEYQTAVRLDPEYAEAHSNLAVALAQAPGSAPQAVAEYEAALKVNPDSAQAHAGLAAALAANPSRLADAMAEYETALRLGPSSAETHFNYGVLLSKIEGRTGDAINQFEAALRLRPDYPEAHSDLGVALSAMPGRLPEAISHFEAATRLAPEYPDAHYNLGVALANSGRIAEAVAQLQIAEQLKPDPELHQLIARLRSGKQ